MVSYNSVKKMCSRGVSSPARGQYSFYRTVESMWKGAACGVAVSLMLPLYAVAKVDEALGIEEIIITAQRRTETTQSSALSVTALSGNDLMRNAKATLAEAIENTPSVSIQSTAQGGQVYIRGVGTNGDGNWIDSAVALMSDNVYTGRAESLGGGLYDVNRVEVLRGPQGTLYGRNATGGTVNILTNTPNTEAFEGQVNTRVGNYDLAHVDGALNLPISDTFALRIAGLWENRDGYFSNNGRESDFTGTRAKFLWNPSEKISLQGAVDYLQQKGDLATTVASTGYDPSAVAPFVPVWDVKGDAWTVDTFHPADVIDYEFTTYSLQLDWELSFGLLTIIPAYTHSERYTTTNLWVGTFFSENDLQERNYEEDQYTAEIRLSSTADSDLHWVAGIYLLESENADITEGTFTLINGYLSLSDNTPTTSEAVFGQATYSLTDKLRITAGLRYTQDEKEQDFGVRSLALTGYDIYDTGVTSYSNDQNEATYKLGFEYDLGNDSMLYGHVATGYKSGGFGTNTFPPVSYDPEELVAYELGSKNLFLEGKLQLNGAIYLYKYTDYQVQVPVQPFVASAQDNVLYSYLQTLPEFADAAALQAYVDAYALAYGVDITDAQFTQYVINSETGENYGLELDIRYLLTPADELFLQYAYTHARYGDFDVNKYPTLAAVSGAEVANAPEHAGVLGYEHRLPFFSGELAARIESKISSGYSTTVGDRGQANDWQDSFTRTSVTLTYYDENRGLTVSLWARNLEDEEQTTMVGPAPLARRMVTDPRTYGLNLSYDF